MNGKKARAIRKQYGVKHVRLAGRPEPAPKVEPERREPTALDQVAK